MKTVEINGLVWDSENLVNDGKRHFTFNEALDAAQAIGKRLPTEEEIESLVALGSTWDEEKKGRWFGNDHELMSESTKSIFLPAAGLRYADNGSFSNAGSNGYYWSSTAYSTTYAYFLYFTSGNVNPGYYIYRGLGFSVRFVS